jgi:hypothetical protein
MDLSCCLLIADNRLTQEAAACQVDKHVRDPSRTDSTPRTHTPDARAQGRYLSMDATYRVHKCSQPNSGDSTFVFPVDNRPQLCTAARDHSGTVFRTYWRARLASNKAQMLPRFAVRYRHGPGLCSYRLPYALILPALWRGNAWQDKDLLDAHHHLQKEAYETARPAIGPSGAPTEVVPRLGQARQTKTVGTVGK